MINCQALDNLGPVACVNVIEPFLQLLCAKGPPSILEPPRPRPWGYASSLAPSSSITFLLSPRISSNPDWFVVIYLFQNVHTAEQQQCNVNTIKVVLVSPFPKLASQHLNYVAYEMVIYFVRAEVYEWNEMRTSMNDKPSQDNHKRSKKFHQQFGIICHTYYICHRGCWCWLRVARLGHDCCFVISFFVSWRVQPHRTGLFHLQNSAQWMERVLGLCCCQELCTTVNVNQSGVLDALFDQ